MTARQIIRRLQADGWYLARVRGSHHQFRHPTKKGLVTVPVHGNKDLSPETVHSILQQAGLE